MHLMYKKASTDTSFKLEGKDDLTVDCDEVPSNTIQSMCACHYLYKGFSRFKLIYLAIFSLSILCILV